MSGEATLRATDPAVIARIEESRVVLDVRTLPANRDAVLEQG